MAVNVNQNSFLVPNICRNSSILMVVLLAQLGAIVAVLLRDDSNYLDEFGLTSLYFLWVALSATFCMCLMRQQLNTQRLSKRLIGICFCFLLPFLGAEIVAQYVVNGLSIAQFDWSRFWSHFSVMVIISGLVIRWFTILGVLETRNKAESQARIQSLQSRIQPHFLFNSLNTISELTATQPQQAEKAIHALSTLFRASLESSRKFHSLEDELNLCRRYLELEKWRLGDLLNVTWSCKVNALTAWDVPKLILQPIVENAVLHGVQLNGAVDITIDIRETNKHLSLMIENTKGSVEQNRLGNGIAIDNIKERLFVLFDDQQTFKVKDKDGLYTVIIQFPKAVRKKGPLV